MRTGRWTEDETRTEERAEARKEAGKENTMSREENIVTESKGEIAGNVENRNDLTTRNSDDRVTTNSDARIINNTTNKNSSAKPTKEEGRRFFVNSPPILRAADQWGAGWGGMIPLLCESLLCSTISTICESLLSSIICESYSL
jgi:hypothetical protein